MKEVKSPKKPLIYYYGIVLLVLVLFNIIFTPLLEQRQVDVYKRQELCLPEMKIFLFNATRIREIFFLKMTAEYGIN